MTIEHGNGVHVDRAELAVLANKLHTTSEHLEEPARVAPAEVDAGPSSGAVCAALSKLTQAAGLLTMDTHDSGDKINAGNGAYGENENRAIDSLDSH